MTAHLRPFVALLLCWLLAFGQIPAWMHVVACEGHEVSSLQAGSSNAPCSTNCSGHKCPSRADSQNAQRSNAPAKSPAEHDSSDCTICQSIFAPAGIVDFQVVVPSEMFDGEWLEPVELAFAFNVFQSLAQPRGPPAV